MSNYIHHPAFGADESAEGPMEAPRRAFARMTRISGDGNEEVLIGNYYATGSCEFEFGVRWHELGRGPLIPRLEVFSDAWDAFCDPAYQRLFEDLSAWCDTRTEESPVFTVDDLCALLRQHGFVDATPEPYVDPYDEAKQALIDAVTANGCESDDEDRCNKCWACLADNFLIESERRLS